MIAGFVTSGLSGLGDCRRVVSGVAEQLYRTVRVGNWTG
jgi:hypothetical protein